MIQVKVRLCSCVCAQLVAIPVLLGVVLLLLCCQYLQDNNWSSILPALSQVSWVAGV